MPKTNLNTLFSKKEQTERGQTQGNVWNIRFDGILPFIIETLQRPETATVVGCLAWLTHPELLKHLADKPCKLVVTASTLSKRTKTAYKRCGIVKRLGRRGKRTPFMHHKFLIGVDDDGNGVWLLNGSFNYSTNATHSLENIICTTDITTIQAFTKEFERIYKIARRIR
jgi:hypothetical protein